MNSHTWSLVVGTALLTAVVVGPLAANHEFELVEAVKRDGPKALYQR